MRLILLLILALMSFNLNGQISAGILTSHVPAGHFSTGATTPVSFSVMFTATLSEPIVMKNILEIPGILTVTIRQHNPANRDRQNYPAFPMPDGSVPVLEASVILHSSEHPDWKNMTIGIPLAMLKDPYARHDFSISFTGIRFTLFVDGELLDNEFPFGYPEWQKENNWSIDKESISEASVCFPAIIPEKRELPAISSEDIQYWTPDGHNSWVGDVVTIYHKGRYHIFYLFDRRHHQSKFGKGAHYFEHLSSIDFKTWTIHEAATPLEAQWECIGTGTPFIYRDSLYLSYGLHTGRIYPDEKTTWPAQWKYLEDHGYTGSFCTDTKPGYPGGSSYAVSSDGISAFKKSGIIFHPCQNPSVYTTPEKRLMMLANAGSEGTWTSDSLNGGWHCIDRIFPPGGDCTFFFNHGEYDYIIGGFSGYWSKPSGMENAPYIDMVSHGLDFYDGSNVPSITEIPGARLIMAAWIPIRGWGGPLVIRELVQFPDGRLGSKWMKETTPETGNQVAISAKVKSKLNYQPGTKSFLLTFTIVPPKDKNSKVFISFFPGSGDSDACEFSINPSARRAQFSDGSLNKIAPDELSLREGGSPSSARNYAIENLFDTDKPFQVRIIVKESAKMGGSLVDVEIAGQRTMITYRPDLIVGNLLFNSEGAEIKDISIAPLKE